MKNQLKHFLLNLIGSNDFSITIRKAGKYRFPGNYMFGIHSHREFEMIYVSSGACVMEINGKLTLLKADDLILISPGIPHYFMAGAKKGCVIVQLEYTVSLPGNSGDSFQFLYCDKESVQLENCSSVANVMEYICCCYRDNVADELTQTRIEFAFAQLHLELASSQKTKKKKDHENCFLAQKQILDFVNQNYESKINIEQLAESFGISSRSIRKYFEDVLGMTCTEYITMLRMEKSKELLWYTKKSITDIAIALGYSSSQYFSKVFHEYAGMSPKKFRNSWRGIIAEEKLYDETREHA